MIASEQLTPEPKPQTVTIAVTNAAFRTVLANLLDVYAREQNIAYSEITTVLKDVFRVSPETAQRIFNRVKNLRSDTIEKFKRGISYITEDPFIQEILYQMFTYEITELELPQKSDAIKFFTPNNTTFVSDQVQYTVTNTYRQSVVTDPVYWEILKQIYDKCEEQDALTEQQLETFKFFIEKKRLIACSEIAQLRKKHVDSMISVDIQMINAEIAKRCPKNTRFMINSSDAPGVMENRKTYHVKYSIRTTQKNLID